MTRDEIILASEKYLFPAVFHYFEKPLVLDHAKDQYVWDADNKQYLDFFGGIVTVSVGHSNENVVRAVRKQAERLVHVSSLFRTEPAAALAAKIASVTPEGLTKSFFTSSGTEAVETAVMLARAHTGHHEIIALRHSYHGRSALGMSLTGHGSWRGAGSAQPGILHAHNAYCYRCPLGLTYPSCDVKCATDVGDLIETATTGVIAGFLAEPIQGIGGCITPPLEYFPIIRDIVKQHGGLLISDEVQTGWGRTGKHWFGIEHYAVEPDILVGAKGLANGLPIGVTVSRPEIADSVRFLTMATFGGNPVSTAAAKAVIDFIEEKDLRANCAEVGAYLRDGLLELQEQFPLIGDVRGMGLLQAMELVMDRETKEPAVEQAARLLEACREHGLLVGKGGLRGNIIRLSPPMNISKADVDEFLRLMKSSFASVGGPKP